MRLLGRRGGRLRVGWVAAGTLHGSMGSFLTVPSPFAMRICNNARWMNRNSDAVRNEIYRPERRYDIVVFFKAMDSRCQEEAERVQRYGGRVVFDANVNYYELWGEYDIEATQPTEEQRRDAVAMTTLADAVVADSSYLLEVVRRYNPRSTWIPDNVDTSRFRAPRQPRRRPTARLVWSGIAKKARPILTIAPALSALQGAKLFLVSETRPAVMDDLAHAIPCRYIRYSDSLYAWLLRRCDVIISPKRLVNAYEVAHTEYKITLGMAAGLPAVASPQQSYVEALADGGGIVADTVEEWRGALERLVAEPELRARLGERARSAVEGRYSTAITARRYEELLCSLA